MFNYDSVHIKDYFKMIPGIKTVNTFHKGDMWIKQAY